MRSVPTGFFRLPLSSQDDNILSSWRWSVKTITALAAKKLGKFLAKDFRRVFGPAHDDMAERLGSFARSTIECLARSDALYHNFEHTLQVTMVGRDILEGMTLSQRIEPTDYSHLIVACLLHDIGYPRSDCVRGCHVHRGVCRWGSDVQLGISRKKPPDSKTSYATAFFDSIGQTRK